ncbi:MAG: DUF1573 domain-containing protein [bacterium]|nr:DUF1573 domain-containing protein [bacterium]
MKKIARIKAAILIAILAASLGLNSAVAGPKMEISDTTFNWGICTQRVNINHTFWIKSVGDETLRITHIKPGCGCTKAPVQDTVLAPGDSTQLQITLNTRAFRGNTVKKPEIRTNASEEAKILRLTLEPMPDADEIRPVTVSALKLDVSQFTEKPRRKAKFKIFNKGEADFDLRLVETGCDHFDIELPAIVPARDSVTASLIVRDASLDEEFDCSFTIEVGKELQQRFTISANRLIRIKGK